MSHLRRNCIPFLLEWTLISILMSLFSTSYGWAQIIPYNTPSIPNCSSSLEELWNPPAFEGKLHSQNHFTSIYFLGKGFKGGAVFLHRHLNGSEKILKYYVSESSLLNDLKVWEKLESLLPNHPSLKLPRRRQMSPTVLEMDYTPTTDLQTLVKNASKKHKQKEGVKFNLKTQTQNRTHEGKQVYLWVSKYIDLVKTIHKALNADPSIVVDTSLKDIFEEDLIRFKFWDPSTQKEYIGMIKPNNLAPVPDQVGQFLLFDPY